MEQKNNSLISLVRDGERNEPAFYITELRYKTDL